MMNKLTETSVGIQCIRMSDIQEIKSLRKFPVSSLPAIECICIILNIRPVKITSNSTSVVANAYEPAFKRILSGLGFIQLLLNIDKNHISSKTVKQVKGVIAREGVTEKKVKACSKTIGAMFQWVLAIITYHDITQQQLLQNPEIKNCERILEVAKKFQIVLVKEATIGN